MADNEMLEGSQSEGTPNPPSSEGSPDGGQRPSQIDTAELLKLIEPLIDKKMQSTKDRRIAKLEQTVSSFAPVLEKFKGLVPDEKLDQIQRDLEFDDLKRRVYGEPSSEETPARQQAETPADDVVSAIDEVLQLPANDPRVTDLKLRFGKDPAAYMREGAKLLGQIGVQREPTPAEVPPTTPGAVARKGDNPIENITDSRTLYRMAAQQIARQQKGRR